jgi:sugar phosphate permease
MFYCVSITCLPYRPHLSLITSRLIATIGSAVANTYSGYMVSRFIQGWGVGPASTVGLQMLQDIYSELERGEKVGYWTASIDLGE